MADSTFINVEETSSGYSRLKHLLSHRFAALGPLESMMEYRRFDDWSERCRVFTRQRHSEQIATWQSGFWLMAKLFDSHESRAFPDIDVADYQRISENESEYYRLSILGLSTRTTKAALDLCLDGYYSQSLALCRSMYETAKRCSYTRIRVEDVYRFMDESVISPAAKCHPNYTRHKNKPDGNEWKQFETELKSDDRLGGGIVSAKLLRAVNTRMNYLNSHAHPEMEGVTDLMERTVDGLDPHVQTLLPEYSTDHATQTLRVGSSAAFALLVEMRYVLPASNALQATHEEWMQRYKDAFASQHNEVPI